MSSAWPLTASRTMLSMASSHSILVTKLPCGTVPQGIVHIRSSFGHATRHEQSAWANATDVNKDNVARTPAHRIIARRPPRETQSAYLGWRLIQRHRSIPAARIRTRPTSARPESNSCCMDDLPSIAFSCTDYQRGPTTSEARCPGGTMKRWSTVLTSGRSLHASAPTIRMAFSRS